MGLRVGLRGASTGVPCCPPFFLILLFPRLKTDLP